MMQLARELKTLAKEFSVAVLVSAAVCEHSCHGREPRFRSPWCSCFG